MTATDRRILEPADPGTAVDLRAGERLPEAARRFLRAAPASGEHAALRIGYDAALTDRGVREAVWELSRRGYLIATEHSVRPLVAMTQRGAAVRAALLLHHTEGQTP